MSDNLESAESLVDRIDFPHKRVPDWVWRPDPSDPANEMISRYRLISFVTKLRALGMADADISCLFSDLYWDSFNECSYNECFGKELY
jgi:hypothetical protein